MSIELDRVKRKSGWWSISHFLQHGSAHAIYPNVYVPPQVYDNIISENPDPRMVRVVIHEFAHLRRQREKGVLQWFVLYALSGDFRLVEELEAIKAEIHFSKEQGIEIDLLEKADILSSWRYLFCISFQGAWFLLRSNWKRI